MTARATPRIHYLSPGLFDMGGIARYGRYQVRALRDLCREHGAGVDHVRVSSLLAPDGQGFDEPVDVDFVGGGLQRRSKVRFAAHAFRQATRPRLHWAGHLHFAAMTLGIATVGRGTPIVNIYGLEVWSNPPASSARALRHCWVVSDCHATLDEAVDRGMVDRSRSVVIWDPIDTDTFCPGEVDESLMGRYGLDGRDRFRVMFLGRLVQGAKHKNPDGLVRAFARADLPADSELLIGGSGDRVPVLKTLASELGVADRVRFLGRIPDADLPGLYRLASVFALVSMRYDGGGEGIPLTPLEAAGCGAPIVVGDEDGSREAPVHGETGFVVPSRDEAALASRLEELAHNPDRRAQMAEASAARAHTAFSYERFRREHVEFLDRIRAQSPGAWL